MKLKQSIFALVAMLSFTFSAFAQTTTVSSQADLETALRNGGEVTLGASITVSSPVIIPSGAEVVLNLNGKTLKATNAKTKVLENRGKLTIDGQGTVSGIIYNGTANGSAAEMTLNGGTYSLDGNNGGLHHYGKTLTINDGVVVKTTSYGVRMAGKGSVLNLYGGTYTSTGSGDMARPLALSNGTVNFLDSDITVNGYMHVMVGQVTVNFGENNQYSPFEAYHQGNSYASSVFYCKTLAEAISRTDFAAVTLVKNVKVADGAPITVNKEIDLNLNGKNLSATNAKTAVLKNYANMTIKGKGTVTGLVYNGDAENKGVAEMTLNGGTYKLDGANGGFFNYGKTLTVNDGVTISSQVYGLRMSNAASVINLNGGTFTSTNSTDNMKRAIAVDAGTINFNDDDITINGYFHANRSKAKVNFDEYCPFDAFMYSTTNASGYYVVNLENAIDKADAGFEIVLQKNIERSEIVTLPKKVTLDGNGKTLTSTAGRAINVDCADVVTIENLTIAGATGCERGINIINKAGTTNLKKVNVSGVSHYAVHVATSAGAAQVNIENSNLTGYAAVAAYGEGGNVSVKNSNLVGINNYADNGSNSFSTIAVGSNVNVNVAGGSVKAVSQEGKDGQFVLGAQADVTGASITADAELITEGTAEYFGVDLDKNTVTVREVYGTNYVTTPAGNGLVTLTGASEAMIGDVKYSTIAQAFAAAKEGEKITLIADVTPSLTSQRAITKAAVVDLNGKTMTLTEDDLYFGTTTFKNGTIVVDPSVKPSTAVFWMFKDQVLTFEGVKLVATGVTGTYLIGLDGDNADLNLFSSEIIVDNETALDLDIICVNASTGNDIWMEDSKVTVKNLDGRVFFRGNYTVAGKSKINLEGITKAGFRIEAGQTLTIKDNAVVNITGEPRDGGIHLTDPSANYTKAETATVNATIKQPQVAKVGETIYKSLIAAVEAVEDGGTITLVANETFTKNNRYNNGGYWDGLGYSGDKSFTIDLAGFTISQDGALNDYLMWFKNDGAKANTITLMNGTLDAGTTAYSALATSSSNAQKITVNLENINVINNNSNGAALKIRGGSELNVKAGTIITGQNSYLGIEAVGKTTVVNIYEGAEIYQNGTSSYCGCLAGASGNSTINVYGGKGQSKSGGFIAMTSGGTINIEGGEWTANTDGTYANGNKSVLVAQSDKQYNAGAGNSIVNVTGGTFKGGYNCYGNKAGDAQINIKGGNFNADPTSYVEDDYIAVENNGVWNVVKATAKIGTTKYTSLEAAFKAATDGCTIEIHSDVTVDYAWDARKTGAKFTVPVTINGNGKTIKFTNSVNDNNYQAAFRFEADATVKNLIVDMSEVTDSRFRAISSKGNLTVDGCKFIGKNETLNCRAIIFGEGAGANVGNLAISITNSEFINWKRGITDNENGQDVKTATITGNTLENAAVYVSAYENVTFTGNTVEGAYVDIRSYTANSSLNVTATGNTLEENTDTAYNYIKATGNIDQEGFKVYAVAKIGDVEYTTIEKAYAALQEGDEIVILKKGSYALKVKNNVTITGAVAGVEFANIGAFGCNGANVTFNNVTFTYAENSTYKGLQHSGNLVYNNCIFNGQVFLYGQSETFNGCTFNTTDSANYNVWTYGAKEVAFNECTFNSAGKSVLIYNESASVTNNVTVTKSQFIASQAVEGKAAIEMDSSLSGAINLTIDGETTATGFGTGNVSGNSLWNNKKGNNDLANNDITVKVGDTVVLAPIFEAQIGDVQYRNFQDAIDAVQNGKTITVLRDIATNVEIKEKDNVKVTIDGNGMKMTGTIKVVALSSDNDRRITIKNFKFEDTTSASVDFITSVETNHYPRITVEDCTFTGSGDATDVALRLKSSKNVEIKNCTGKGLHSFLQNTSGWNLTIEGVTVTESKSAFALGTVQGVTVKGCTVDVPGYGIRMDAGYNNNAVIADNNIKAFIPVVVRKATVNSNIAVNGTNNLTATNEDGIWCAIGTSEYEANGAMPTAATGNVVVALNDAALDSKGIYGNALVGQGTAEAPYLINNIGELVLFRNSVNAGETKYSAPGVHVALGADIDMAGENWVGIGSATADHGFMGNFDGKNFKIKNLTITDPALDSDGYAYAGLFGVTEGTDKDNQNTIKNLTIENVTINTTGDIVSAAIAYPYYTIVDNVKVCGNIAITGGNYTAGVLAYTRRCVNASNLSIDGNDGSYVKGNQTVGGVISDIQMNGGLTAVYSNFSAEGITVTGEKMVGGIAGIIATQTLNGAAVKNVTLNSTDEFAGVVAGRLGGTSTISNVVSENVTGATSVIGATYDGAKAVEARIGDTYYSTFAAAYTAAKAGETVTMLADLNMSEILVLDKAITLDGGNCKLTSTAARAINVDCEGNVGIKNLTINASGERAINVITKPANVTIEGVTATAANYTVNVASSAGAAKVAITGSNLTGLNVVNVTAPGAEVTINGGTITCNDQTDVECYAALNLTKEAVGAKIAAASDVTFDIKGDSKKASNGAVDGVITIGGSTDEVDVIVAYIQYGNYYNSYTSIEAAIAKAKDGETIGLIRDITTSDIITIDKAITLDGNGKTLTSTAGRAINVSGADGVTIKNLTIDAKGERAINVIQNATNVTIDNVTATAANYTVNVASSAPNAVVAIKNSTLNGLCTVNVAAAGAQVTVDNSTVNCNDNNTTAGESYAALCLNKAAVGASIVARNSTINVTAGSDSEKGRNGAENGTVTINGSTEGVTVTVAVITYPGSDNYHGFSSLADAVEFAKAGDVITLIRDITTSAQININKNVAIDGCHKKLTVNAARGFQITGGTVAISDLTIDMPNAAEGNRGINLYNGDTNAALDVTLNNVTINGGKAYAVNIGGGKDNKLTINGSTLTGYAAINVHTSSVNHTIVVDGSTLNGKNHNNNYSFGTVVIDGTNAHSLTITNTTITTENLEGVTSKYEKVVVGANCTLNWDGGEAAVRSILADSKGGKLYYTDLQTAINDAAEVSGTVQILGNITATKSIAIPAAKKVTIDLNGKTITGTDNETKSYGLININPGAELTINDATGNGAIKLEATQNRGWNAYSSVISNQRGKLTVNGGTIEHLGGTDMAYAIDNLTNGKGTKAETIINGGVIKSTYRAIRQFLNGTEAQNLLTVNGGTIEGANKSIWMQDPSANANTGSLSVAADAKLNGDVYLFVTAGSTEWPVSVSIAAAALQGESKVVTGNVPAGYDVAEVNGAYGVYTGVAKIGTAYYETLKAAVAAAQAGETITLIDNVEATEVILLGKSLTINGNGYKVTSNATRVFRATTSNTEITLNDVNMVNTAVRVGTNDIRGISVDDVQNVKLTLNNCSVDFTDASANDWTYAVNVVGGSGHVVTVNGGAYEGANVINVRGANQTVIVKDAVLTSLYPNNALYFGACIYVVQNENSSVVATGNTFNGDNAFAFNVGYTPVDESDNIDNTKYVVAMIGDAYYTSIQAAVEAAQNGETIKLTQNVKMDTKNLATQNDGYATIVNVEGKAVTLDLNGKKITVDAAAADLASANGKMLLAVFSADLGGHLTLTDNTEAKNGAVTLNVNDAKVYSMFASESKESDKSNSGKITVNGGNYTTVGKVSNAMFFTDANEVITVNGGNFHCDGASTTANYPWMFNTVGNNERHVTVNGGTFNVDINHQHRPFEVYVPETLAVKANDNGTWKVVPAEAYITEMLGATVNEAGEWGRKVGYATIAEAIAAVNELGNKVSIAEDLELTEAVVVPADKNVVLDLNGKTVTMNDASGAAAALLKNNGNLTIMDGTEAKAGKLSFKTTTPSAANAYASNTISNYGVITIESGNVENLSVGGGACYALDNYAGSTATINGGKLTAEKTAVRIFNWTNGEEAKATINMNGGEIYSKNGYGINVNSGNAPFVALNITGGTITTDYADYKLAVYVVNKGTAENFTANVTGGTFNGIFALNGVTAQTMKQGAVAVSGGTFEGVTCYDDPAYGFVSGGTFKSAVDAKAVATGFICKDYGNDTFGVIVDPKHGKVAQIIRNDYYAENQYFATINDAVQAAVNGETVTLIADVETSAAGYATITDGYAVIVAVKEKEITIDLNGKSVTVNVAATDVAEANSKFLMAVFGVDTDGNLTLTGEGSVKVVAEEGTLYSLAATYGERANLTIENGSYEANAVHKSGSLIYAHQQQNSVTVNDGTYKLGNLATGANGSPWIFNTLGKNMPGITVNGGTYPTDINHQFWANEVIVPETLALKDNGDGTWTVVEAAAYTNEKNNSQGSWRRHVGYATIEEAIAATGERDCEDNVVALAKNVEIEQMITVANGVEVTLDLNGKTLAATDNTSKNYSAIDNRGDLTIVDSSEDETGKITVKATVNSGWNRYSAVIANNPGGELTVMSGTIEHLGGTDMAYGIDNLTNGKGTHAVTEIYGGTVKSEYIAVRQFLNGVEANNALAVYGGTLEGKYSIYFQDPSAKANSGSLYVDAEAALNASVYLGVTEGSTEWPVEVSIATDALKGESTVISKNVPATYHVTEYPTAWIVECSELAELTIDEANYAETGYINLVQKNVEALTYVREFTGAWETIYLPFDLPVADLMEDFEFAYIYNASNKNNEINIDYVVIEDDKFVLMANYPYLIKAKEAGEQEIVVATTLKKTTEQQSINCSTVFETFEFIGNYAANFAPEASNFKKNFEMVDGEWTSLDALSPFRFYFQMTKRNGKEFPADVQNIRMRNVDENGDATGIDGIDAENAGDFIFDLHGRRVLEPLKGGLYIINGKKVLF